MADAGLFRGQRVELVGGEIVEMAAQKDPHVIGVSLASKAIASAFGVGFWVRTQAPLNLGKKDDPEPDVAVVPGSERDYIGSENRADALLVVEVSDTTLAYDRGRKARRYARSGIGDYWIVNILDQQLEGYRDPIRRGIQFQFGSVAILRRGQTIAPLGAPRSRVRVVDLLP
jgi:Uma2 family endonuclease